MTSETMTILWRVLTVAPNGLPQWVTVRAGTEGAAQAEALRHRPEWTIAKDPSDNPIVRRER